MDSTPRDSLPPDATIGRTALRVNSLEDQVAFYESVVGLEVIERDPRAAELGVEDTPLLVLEADETFPRRPRTAAGLFHTAFRVPSRVALGDALGRIRTDWELDGAADHLASEALYCTDPEGNGVEIYRDLPRETWERTEAGQIKLPSEALDLDSLATAAGGESGAPAGTDIGHVHLEVTDLSAFEDFYVDLLGFQVQANLQGARFVAAGEYHHHIGANVWNHRTTPREGRGLAWFEVVLPDEHSVRALRDTLMNDGVPVSVTADGVAVRDGDDIEIRFRSNER